MTCKIKMTEGNTRVEYVGFDRDSHCAIWSRSLSRQDIKHLAQGVHPSFIKPEYLIAWASPDHRAIAAAIRARRKA